MTYRLCRYLADQATDIYLLEGNKFFMSGEKEQDMIGSDSPVPSQQHRAVMQQRLKILVVEEDSTVQHSILRGLSNLGHECEGVNNGEAAFQHVLRELPDVIILALLLPGMSGIELLQAIRAKGIKCPIIVLTALGAVEDRVRGLRLGADDYLVKPFAFDELVARIDAVWRRAMLPPIASLQAGDMTLNLIAHCVERGGEVIELSQTEFSALELLMRHQGHVVTRDMLCRNVRGFDRSGNTNAIEVQINRLRRKIDRDGEESMIKTIRGRGYAIRVNHEAASTNLIM